MPSCCCTILLSYYILVGLSPRVKIQEKEQQQQENIVATASLVPRKN